MMAQAKEVSGVSPAGLLQELHNNLSSVTDESLSVTRVYFS